ncbi:NADH-quinone oxidoreductase subunit J [Sorangium sp. So ce448]|uniref:NADH-quinone oxidoreductase subunit J family protein n=1 Tax=Sorangium sp. So ce448 TaxID=3133314 RepID=UPI003F648A4A
MKIFEFAFFGLASLLVLLGGLATVAARNPIRGAMGLLTSIVGIAGLYLMLSAEFLAAIQILVYAGAIVILFLFVIMLLGPSATSPRDARTAVPRYVGAGVLGASSIGALALVASASKPGVLAVPAAPESLGTIEALGHELFTKGIVPFELSGALLLVAVIGAVAVARGKQVDPTLLPAGEGADAASPEPGDQGAAQPGALAGHATLSAKEPH